MPLTFGQRTPPGGDAGRGLRGCLHTADRRGYAYAVISPRLGCSTFWVDVRLRELKRQWFSSADTLDGPSLRLGNGATEAVEHALEPWYAATWTKGTLEPGPRLTA